jgi:hypothetical protein
MTALTVAGNGADSSDGRDGGWPQLSAAAFYGLPGRVVAELAPHTEADRASLLMELLAQAGNALGPSAYMQVGADRHYTNLYVLICGDTADARKGVGHNEIRRLHNVADPGWSANNIATGLSSGEGIVARVRDPDPVKNDPGVADKRLLVTESEFGAVIATMRRRGSTLQSSLRAAWDRRNMGVLTRHNRLWATSPFVSIIGHITTSELTKSLDELALVNGFANRFLFVAARRSQLLPHGGALGDDVFARLACELYESLEHGRRLRRLRFTPEAARQWAEIYPGLSTTHGLLGAIVARAAPQALRLSTLYAALDRDSEPGKVTLPHLQAGLAVVGFSRECARYIFRGKLIGDVVADRIIEQLRRRSCTRTELHDLFKGHVSTKRISEALDRLLDLGLARCTSTRTAGRSR